MQHPNDHTGLQSTSHQGALYHRHKTAPSGGVHDIRRSPTPPLAAPRSPPPLHTILSHATSSCTIIKHNTGTHNTPRRLTPRPPS